jgi:hypothetical protein
MFNQALWQMNRERQHELLQLSANRQLVAAARGPRLNLRARLLVTLGRLLISLGLRMKARVDPVSLGASTSAPEVTPGRVRQS